MIDSNFEKQYNAEAIRDTMAILTGNMLEMNKTLSEIRQTLRTTYRGDVISLKEDGKKVQQLIDDHIRSLRIDNIMKVREITDQTFLSDIAKITKDKEAQTALIKNRSAQIIAAKSHLNPSYYEKMKERLDVLIKEVKEKRIEDADYFNRYKEIFQELLEENELKDLGFSNRFEFAVYGELLKVLKDSETSKTYTKKISEDIREETELVGWKTKTSSEKQIGNIIYDVLSEIQYEKLTDDENKKNEMTERIIELAKNNL